MSFMREFERSDTDPFLSELVIRGPSYTWNKVEWYLYLYEDMLPKLHTGEIEVLKLLARRAFEDLSDEEQSWIRTIYMRIEIYSASFSFLNFVLN